MLGYHQGRVLRCLPITHLANRLGSPSLASPLFHPSLPTRSVSACFPFSPPPPLCVRACRVLRACVFCAASVFHLAPFPFFPGWLCLLHLPHLVLLFSSADLVRASFRRQYLSASIVSFRLVRSCQPIEPSLRGRTPMA